MLAALALSFLSTLTLKAADQPNVLLLSVDDLKPLIGAYGFDEIPTPNMDRLAARGTTMLNNHCQQAVCAPSRMSMFTGLRPDSTKVWDLRTQIQDSNPDAVTMQQWFKEAGYTTAGSGKVMHGARNEHPESWSIPFTHKKKLPFNEAYPVPAHDNAYYQNEKSHAVQKEMDAKGITHWKERFEYLRKHDAQPAMECLDLPDDAYVDGALAVWASDLLEQFAKSKEPFFLTVGFAKPHLPFVAPKKYWDMFDPDEIDLAEFREQAKDSPDFAYHKFGELRSYTGIPDEWNQSLDDELQRDLIHGYYACVAYVDAQIGKVLDTLDSTGLADNTIVVLWGDHGYHLGDHGMWNKHSNFEQATFAPLIISAPGYKGGQKAEGMTEMVDIFPTLVELAHLDSPYALEGESLVPVMADPSATVKDYSISQYPRGQGRMGYTLRSPRYRLVMWMSNDWRTTDPYREDLLSAVELYDYQKDPNETVNLANDPAYQDELAKLKAQMLEYFAQYAIEPEPVPAYTGASKQPSAGGDLFSLEALDASQIDLRFATAKKSPEGIQVHFENVPKWPSIEFIAKEGMPWDVSSFSQVDIEITNHSPYTVRTAAWIANPGDSGKAPKRNSAKLDIPAGQTTTLTIPIDPAQYALDLRNIKTIRLFVDKLQGSVDYTIHSVKGSGSPTGGAVSAPQAAKSTPTNSGPAAKIGASGALLDLSDANQLKTDLRFASISDANDGVVMDFDLSPKWPSVDFFAQGGNWDLSQYRFVEATITNLNSSKERVFVYLSNPYEDFRNKKKLGSGKVDLNPGESKTIRLNLAEVSPDFDLSDVEAFRVFTGKHQAPVKLKLSSLQAVQ
ncbi:MAG: sulfatase [Puniceicoccales bacterium]